MNKIEQIGLKKVQPGFIYDELVFRIRTLLII